MRLWLHRLTVVLTLAFCLIALAARGCSEERYTVDRPTQVLRTALYVATIDVQRHMLSEIRYTVRAEDVGHQLDRDRSWWTPPELANVLLEDGDYRNSGYDRGHMRALLLSANHPQFNLVNCTAVIVPQTPALNRGPWKQWEAEVDQLAQQYGSVDVQIVSLFDDPSRQLPESDEPHEIPTQFRVTTLAGHDEREYLFPNSLTVDVLDCYRLR